MQYKKYGHGFWLCLAGAVFCFLFLSPLSLSAQSSGPLFNSDGSVTLSAEDYLAVVEEVQGLRMDLASLKKINEAQLTELQALRPQVALLKAELAGLKADNLTQAGLLKAQQIGLTDLTSSWEFQKSLSIVGWTVGGISILANIGQAIAYKLK